MNAKRRITLGSAIAAVVLCMALAAMATARRGNISFRDTRWIAWERFQVITTTTEDGWRQLIINVR